MHGECPSYNAWIVKTLWFLLVALNKALVEWVHNCICCKFWDKENEMVVAMNYLDCYHITSICFLSEKNPKPFGMLAFLAFIYDGFCSSTLILNFHYKHESGFHGTFFGIYCNKIFCSPMVLNNQEDCDLSSVSFYFPSLTPQFHKNWNKFLIIYKMCNGKHSF